MWLRNSWKIQNKNKRQNSDKFSLAAKIPILVQSVSLKSSSFMCQTLSPPPPPPLPHSPAKRLGDFWGREIYYIDYNINLGILTFIDCKK